MTQEQINRITVIAKRICKLSGKSFGDTLAEVSKRLNASSDIETQLKALENYKEATTGVPVTVSKIGRNDLCVCGSGKKYKKCCYDKILIKHQNK